MSVVYDKVNCQMSGLALGCCIYTTRKFQTKALAQDVSYKLRLLINIECARSKCFWFETVEQRLPSVQINYEICLC